MTMRRIICWEDKTPVIWFSVPAKANVAHEQMDTNPLWDPMRSRQAPSTSYCCNHVPECPLTDYLASINKQYISWI